MGIPEGLLCIPVLCYSLCERYLAWLSSLPDVSSDINIVAQGEGPVSCSAVVPLIWRAVTGRPCSSLGRRCWGPRSTQSASCAPSLHPSTPHLPEPGCSRCPKETSQQTLCKRLGALCPPTTLDWDGCWQWRDVTGFCFALLCQVCAQEQSQCQRWSQLTRDETWS